MTQLSRLGALGLTKESVAGTYVAPTVYLPYNKVDYTDDFNIIKDMSFRGNDTKLQGLYQGAGVVDWSIDVDAYPDLIGHFLRGVIGPDTVSAGVTTTLASSSSIGATSISSTATIPVGSYIQIDTSTNLELAKVTAVSGSGPYTLTVTTLEGGAVGLAKAHTSSVAIVSATTHTFKQNATAAKATYSFTAYDTLQTLGYTDVVFSDLDVKIDPKGIVSLSVKGKSLLGVAESAMTTAYTSLEPLLGWGWTMTNGGSSSTRGLTYDVKLKRDVDVINSSDGTQGPREIFQGALDVTGAYKAIFDSLADLNLYLTNSQQPATATIQQPVEHGGASLALTMSKSGWSKGKRDWGDYVQATFSLDGIYNTTDAGAISAVLKNFVTTAY